MGTGSSSMQTVRTSLRTTGFAGAQSEVQHHPHASGWRLARTAPPGPALTPFLPPVTAGLSDVASAASAWRGVHSTARPPVYSHPPQASGATGSPRLAAVSVVISTVPALEPAGSSCSQQWSSLTCLGATSGTSGYKSEPSSEHPAPQVATRCACCTAGFAPPLHAEALLLGLACMRAGARSACWGKRSASAWQMAKVVVTTPVFSRNRGEERSCSGAHSAEASVAGWQHAA